jgi:hypothetical protein
MTHGVHPAVKEVETPDAAAIRDSVTVQADGEQLRDRHHSMLPSRHVGQRNVGCAEFVGTIAMNTAHPVYVRAPEPTKGAPPPFRHSSMRSS